MISAYLARVLDDERQREVLGLVWSGECVSRLELSRRLGVSKVTISSCVDRLMEVGFLVEEDAVPSQRGRRPIALALPHDAFHAVGVSLYFGVCKTVLVNARGEVVEEASLEGLPSKMPARAEVIIKTVNGLIKSHAIKKDRFVGAGFVLPGILDPTEGRVVSSAMFPEDKDFLLAPIIAKGLGAPCRLINIPHLLALIEGRWGKGRGMADFLYFHSGFGLGMVLNGRLCRGSQCRAGEVGSMQIREHGGPDADGRFGTLGSVAAFHKATDRIEAVIASGGNTLVKKYLPPGENKVHISSLVKAVADGDQFCAQLVSETFSVIGEAALNLAYIFNPAAIFFEPWTARCPEVTVDVVRRMMGHYGLADWRMSTKVISSDCGNEDLARGAAFLPPAELFGVTL